MIHQLSTGAVTHGVHSKVLALTYGPNLTMDYSGYRIHLVQTNFELASTKFSFAAFKIFRQLAQDADIVHYHYPWPFMDVVHFCTCCNKPTLVTYHSDIVRQKHLLYLYRPLQRLFLHAVDHIVVTSANYLATSTELTPYHDKISVIPIGLDKNTYPLADTERKITWQKRLGKGFFLFVGVIRYYKGLFTLVEAAQGTDYPIVIVGAGPIKSMLEAYTIKLGVTNIHFLNALPDQDKVALLELCTAVVFPSHLRSEAFGISLLEGAMYGKPMISSEIGTGTSYINIDGETGLVVPPGDSEALRRAMDFLWKNSPIAKSMGQRAARRYWNLFTAQSMVSKYVELYQHLSKKKL